MNSRTECARALTPKLNGILGNVELVLFSITPMQVSHTTRHVARGRSDEFSYARQITVRNFLGAGMPQVILRAGT